MIFPPCFSNLFIYISQNKTQFNDAIKSLKASNSSPEVTKSYEAQCFSLIPGPHSHRNSVLEAQVKCDWSPILYIFRLFYFEVLIWYICAFKSQKPSHWILHLPSQASVWVSSNSKSVSTNQKRGGSDTKSCKCWRVGPGRWTFVTLFCDITKLLKSWWLVLTCMHCSVTICTRISLLVLFWHWQSEKQTNKKTSHTAEQIQRQLNQIPWSYSEKVIWAHSHWNTATAITQCNKYHIMRIWNEEWL